jgi:ATP-dependent helicase/nuclease subunit A
VGKSRRPSPDQGDLFAPWPSAAPAAHPTVQLRLVQTDALNLPLSRSREGAVEPPALEEGGAHTEEQISGAVTTPDTSLSLLPDCWRPFAPNLRSLSVTDATPMGAEDYGLDQNLALMAGAGAGKTYSLVTICLHLLGGARAHATRRALRPAQLFLLTFTEKAAAEMRQRLRERLDALARDDSKDIEPELRASFVRLGLPFPSADAWRGLRDELGAATISTFHALCVQLLRTAPGGFDVDPAFSLLEERESWDVLRDTAERCVLDALERDDPQVMDLCRELGFSPGGRGGSLVGALCRILTQMREEGLDPALLDIDQPERARVAFDQAVARAKGFAEQCRAAAVGRHAPRAAFVQECVHLLRDLTIENYAARRKALERAAGELPSREPFKELKFALVTRNGAAALRELYVGWAILPHQEAFRGLVAALADRHRAELRRRGALDFAEMLIRTRDLLRDHPVVRREVQERMGALLVDEFQDTNGLQLELVTLLAEQREGGPRTVAPGQVADLPLEPAFLCAVGDRKQSIYEFRGADVSVIGRLAERIRGTGGEQRHLQRNWRSTSGLLQFFNRLFAKALAPQPDARDYEVAYEPRADDLAPARLEHAAPPCVDRICFDVEGRAEEGRRLDAEAVARHVRSLLGPVGGATVYDKPAGWRPARGGDVAILLRRFTYVETYRQALVQLGIPHRVIRGRGFFGAQEVLDLASLLSLLADPSDDVALVGVLRSPWVALSDASLFRLAWQSGRRLTFRDLLESKWRTPEGLPTDEVQRLDAFIRLFEPLRRERDRLGLRTLLKVAVESSGFRIALAGTAFGEQALANVDKLLDLAGRRDSAGRSDCAAFARELVALADADPSEAQADTLDAADSRAVQLLTIHQSKGLEWPIVVVPELAAPVRPATGLALFERQRGLAVKGWLDDEAERIRPPRFREISGEISRRDRAENHRLLYVALTRAKDRLVLSGSQESNSRTWRELIDSAIDADPELRALVRDVRLDDLRALPAVPARPELAREQTGGLLSAAVARVRERPAPAPRTAAIPVTSLQNFFLCPRRYLYANEVGLTEFPVVFELEEPAGLPEGRSAADPREQGTLAHRLLERVGLDRIGSSHLHRHLEELLWTEGVDPAEPRSQEIIGSVEGFLATDFAGRSLRNAGPRVHRELPFLLRVGTDQDGLTLHVKGQIDLLIEDAHGGATVVDYKFSHPHPAGIDPYRFQLRCYALAAQHMVKPGVPVQTGIAFLRGPRGEPVVVPPYGEGELGAFRAELLVAARQLLTLRRGGEWPGHERAECERIHCGYRYRCHPADAGGTVLSTGFDAERRGGRSPMGR